MLRIVEFQQSFLFLPLFIGVGEIEEHLREHLRQRPGGGEVGDPLRIGDGEAAFRQVLHLFLTLSRSVWISPFQLVEAERVQGLGTAHSGQAAEDVHGEEAAPAAPGLSVLGEEQGERRVFRAEGSR